MCNTSETRELSWDSDMGEDVYKAKRDVLNILKEHKVSISKTRYLFNKILREIEDNNPINI